MKRNLFFLLLILSAGIVINSCKKDESDSSATNPTSGNSTITAAISGRVTNESGNPVYGVSVTSNGNSASTDMNGVFLLQGSVDEDRCVLQLTKAGYLNRAHAIIPKSDVINYVTIVLGEEPPAQSVNAVNGGIVNIPGGATVLFEANSFVIAGTNTPYTGTVSVTTKFLDVDDPDFGKMIPGGDLLGKDANGSNVALYSYGMIGVIIRGSSGELLQLASSSQATLTCPIASSQQSSAPQTLPLWFFDEEDNLWKEEGQATRVGNNYIGNVSHFSWWNYDVPSPRANIIGRVVDCEGTPLENIAVTVNGQNTIGTDEDGYYSNWVPVGIPLTFQVLPQGHIESPSIIVTAGPLSNGQTFVLPDLTVACGSYITVSLIGCESQPTSGFAILYDNNYAIISYHYSASGNLRVIANENSSYTLALNSTSGETTIPVTTGNLQDSVSIGTVQLCTSSSTSTYTNGFNIHGHGFISQDVIYMSPISYANHFVGVNQTGLNTSGLTNIGDVHFDCRIPGNQETAFDYSNYIGQGVDSIHFTIAIYDNDNSLYVPIHGLPFVVNITEYGNVGDTIKGTFSGRLQDLNSSSNIFITDGKFAILRGPDLQ